jgi:hypothetical protein
MMFTKSLRPRVRAGEITSSVRIWLAPRVRIGGRYPLLDGQVEVTGITEVDLADITDEVARRGGFESRNALLATARHGRGERVFIIDFVFAPGPPAP